VTTNRDDTTYDWQYSTDKKTWNSLGGSNTAYPGGTTKTLSFVVTTVRASRYYRCIVKSGTSQLTSSVVQVTIAEAFKITAQPKSTTAEANSTVSFTVTTNRDDTTYDWQYSTDKKTWNSLGGSNTAYPGGTTKTLSFVVTTVRASRYYRCIVKSGTSQLTSDVVQVEIVIVVNGVVYEILNSNDVSVLSYSGNASSITIPQVVQGYTVTKIGNSAFENNQRLISIDLPDTITVIGKRAFAGCTKLTTMN